MAILQQSEVNGLRLGRGAGGCVNSTAFGRCALNSTNNYSTGIGYRVGQCDASAATFIGAKAGQYNSGSSNTAAGFGALQSPSGGGNTASENVAIGFNAFNCATTGNQNVVIGSLAFETGSSQINNVVLGSSAAKDNPRDNAVVIGVEASCYNSGYREVVIGHRANRNGGGKNNVIIGRCAGYANAYNNVVIIGTDVSVTGYGHIVWGNSNNNVYNCVWGGWSYFSDARDKTDIEPLTCDTGIKFIKKLRPVSFNLDNRKNYVDKCSFVYGQKDGTLAIEKKEYGFIAQELEQVLEELNITDFSGLKYNEDKDAYRLAYAELLSPLTKAIQELDERTQALKLKIGI
jgi:hypothetical protein